MWNQQSVLLSIPYMWCIDSLGLLSRFLFIFGFEISIMLSLCVDLFYPIYFKLVKLLGSVDSGLSSSLEAMHVFLSFFFLSTFSFPYLFIYLFNFLFLLYFTLQYCIGLHAVFPMFLLSPFRSPPSLGPPFSECYAWRCRRVSEALSIFLHTFFFLSLDWKTFTDPSPSWFILPAYSLNALLFL